ncbi:MAG: aspartate--tRNA ligase [Firmicutes bacterium]|nr:aspartate--tRNA ligase [Bacillota bacterium]
MTEGFRRTHWAGELRAGHVGERVWVAGWVHRRRNHGGLVFLDVRDRSGVVQVVVRPEDGEAFALAEGARPETVVRVVGHVRARAPQAVNPHLATGEVEIAVERLEILSRPDPLPFLPTDRGVDEAVRLRHRYIDLRRPEMLDNLRLRHRLTRAVRRALDEQGFIEVETPTMTRSTPEGARDFLVPSRLWPGRFYALPQSPQLFKQLLMVGGVERYYQLARCYRDEDLRADRQPEFTQIDVEMAFVEAADVQAAVEAMMARVFEETVGFRLELPLPRLSWRDALDRYGTDKPDLRYGLAAVDVGEAAAQSGLPVLARALAQGGAVRALSVPDAGRLSRRDLDALVAAGRETGAAVVAWIREGDGRLGSSFGAAAPEEALSALRAAAGAAAGETVLVVAGPLAGARAAVGAVRAAAARRLGLVPEGPTPPALLWVTDFPLFEVAADGRLESAHHPFTAPADEDLPALLAGEGDPRAFGSKAYDLVLNGFELGSGSIRIHRTDVQEAVFRLLGIGPERARERFGFLLDGLRAGAPPHGGIAIGVDRLAMLLAGASSLREVLAFPKSASGLDPLTDAPAAVDPEQLAELGIEVRPPAAVSGAEEGRSP